MRMTSSKRQINHLKRASPLLFAPTPAWAATSSPIDLEPLLWIIAGLFLLVVAGSFFLATKLYTGRARTIAVLVVLACWGAVYERLIGGPGREESAEMKAREQCDQDLVAVNQMPNGGFFEVDGILDEVTALSSSQVMTLLTKRNLKFVELKVQKRPNGRMEITKPDRGNDGWAAPLVVGTFVRLEISQEGDTRCLAKTSPLYGLGGEINMPPFLPDTCLAATYSNAPTARYSIDFADRLEGTKRMVSWQIRDRATNTVLAQLTGIRPTRWVSTSDLSYDQTRLSTSCRAPHTALVDRLRAATDAPLHAQIMKRLAVVANQSPDRMATNVQGYAAIRPFANLFSFDDQEYEAVVNRTTSLDEWQRAINEAKSSGFASYGNELVDWERRTLVRLQTTGNGSGYPWKGHPWESGFLVWSDNGDWGSGTPELISFYSKSGDLEWAKVIKGAKSPPISDYCTGAPREVRSSKGTALFYRTCAVVPRDKQRVPGKEHEGIFWSVDKAELSRSIQPSELKPKTLK